MSAKVGGLLSSPNDCQDWLMSRISWEFSEEKCRFLGPSPGTQSHQVLGCCLGVSILTGSPGDPTGLEAGLVGERDTRRLEETQGWGCLGGGWECGSSRLGPLRDEKVLKTEVLNRISIDL